MIGTHCQSTFTECLSRNHLLQKVGIFIQCMKILSVSLALHTFLLQDDKVFFFGPYFS